MTLQEAKDHVAKKHGFKDWSDYQVYMKAIKVSFQKYDIPWMNAAELYAQSQVNEALDEVDKVLDKVLSSTAKSLVHEELKKLKR